MKEKKTERTGKKKKERQTEKGRKKKERQRKMKDNPFTRLLNNPDRKREATQTRESQLVV